MAIPLDNVAQGASSESYFFLPYTYPVHLPGLISTDVSDSPHLPGPQRAIPPEVPSWTDIGPERMGTDLGMNTSFKYISNDQDVIKRVTLIAKFSPLVAGAGGANPRYPDNVLCHAIDHVTFEIGGVVIQTLYGEEIGFSQQQESTQEELGRIWTMQRAGLTVPQRVSLADPATNAGGFTAMLELPFFWTENASKHWHNYACQRQTRIEIFWRDPNVILQQDVANTKPVPSAGFTTYISNMFLRFSVSALDMAVKTSFLSSVVKLGNSGVSYLMKYNQFQSNNVVLAGAVSTRIDLTNFSRPTPMIRFVIRPNANLIPNYMNNERFLINGIASFELDSNGHRLFPLTDDFYAKYVINGKTFNGNPAINLYSIPLTDYADVKEFPMGNIEFGKLTNANLLLNFPAFGANQIVDIWAYCYDYARLVVTADNRSAVSLEQPI
jgi:hypothetical protein